MPIIVVSIADMLPVWVRALLACVTCLFVGLLFGNRCVTWLQARFREPIKSISPTVERLHQHKAATPTMGGLFIVLAIVVSALVFADLRDARVGISLLAIIGFAAIGAVDDLVKLRTNRRGISAKAKLAGQIVLAINIAALLGNFELLAGFGAFAFAAFVLIASANGVNLSDGLDGLATGCALLATIALAAVLWISGAQEVFVLALATAGTLAAFLKFNCHPARVFMGDTGSQALGALLGMFAILSQQGWLLAIIGGVFVVEAASVIIQLANYRIRGKRFFLCAPLHHHFQFLGWQEKNIVRVFWAMGVACVALGMLFIDHPAQTPASKTFAGSENFSPLARVQPTAPVSALSADEQAGKPKVRLANSASRKR